MAQKFVKEVITEIQVTSRGKSISYGQAQKPVNVFLKVYVDWANLPNNETSAKLRPDLYVPLDDVVIKYTKKYFPQYYRKFNLRRVSLSKIDKAKYYSWQRCFREICPEKPLIIDVFWAYKRFYKILEEIICHEEKSISK